LKRVGYPHTPGVFEKSAEIVEIKRLMKRSLLEE
jgi:hypothetical protein